MNQKKFRKQFEKYALYFLRPQYSGQPLYLSLDNMHFSWVVEDTPLIDLTVQVGVEGENGWHRTVEFPIALDATPKMLAFAFAHQFITKETEDVTSVSK